MRGMGRHADLFKTCFSWCLTACAVCLPAGLSGSWQELQLRLAWLCRGMKKNSTLYVSLVSHVCIKEKRNRERTCGFKSSPAVTKWSTWGGCFMLHTSHKLQMDQQNCLTGLLLCLALFQMLNWSQCIPYKQTFRIIIGYCRFVIMFTILCSCCI